MAPSATTRIVAALNQLTEVQEAVQTHAAQAEAQHQHLQAQDDQIREQVNRILTKKQRSETRLAQSRQRLDDVLALASQDTEAIQERMTHLGQVIGSPPEGEALEELLEEFEPHSLSESQVRAQDPDANEEDEVEEGDDEKVEDEEEGNGEAEGEDGVEGEIVSEGAAKHFRATIGGDRPDNFILLGAKAYSYLPWATQITLSKNGRWLELECCECGGNTSPSTSGPFRGVNAVHHHLMASHDYSSMPMEEVMKLCSKREVPLEEVKEICRKQEEGMPYIKEVVAKTKTTERTKGAPIRQPIGFQGQGENAGYTWRFATNSANMLTSSPHVVKTPSGKHHVLECFECHGNSANGGRRGFIKGPKGFADHLRQAHGLSLHSDGPSAVVERCSIQVLSEREVDKLRRGAVDAPKVDVIKKVNSVRSANANVVVDKAAQAQARLQKDLHGSTGTGNKRGAKAANLETYGRGMRPTTATYQSEEYDDDDDEYEEEPAAKKSKKSSRAKKSTSKTSKLPFNCDDDLDDEEPLLEPKKEDDDDVSDNINVAPRTMPGFQRASTPAHPWEASDDDDDQIMEDAEDVEGGVDLRSPGGVSGSLFMTPVPADRTGESAD